MVTTTNFDSEKQAVINNVSKDWAAFQKISKELRDDKDVVLAALRCDPENFDYVSERLRSDREVITVMIEGDGGTLEKLSPELQNDDAIVKAAALSNGLSLRFANEKFWTNRYLVALYLKAQIENYRSDDFEQLENDGAFDFLNPKLLLDVWKKLDQELENR